MLNSGLVIKVLMWLVMVLQVMALIDNFQWENITIIFLCAVVIFQTMMIQDLKKNREDHI